MDDSDYCRLSCIYNKMTNEIDADMLKWKLKLCLPFISFHGILYCCLFIKAIFIFLALSWDKNMMIDNVKLEKKFFRYEYVSYMLRK